MRNASFLLLMWSVLFTTTSRAESPDDKDIEVKVNMARENVIVDVTFSVPATQREVWDVLVDFDHMADFVFQRGAAIYGPIRYPFESTRKIRLMPFHKIRTQLICGNMRKMEIHTGIM